MSALPVGLRCALRLSREHGPCSPQGGRVKEYGGRMYCKRHYPMIVKEAK